MFAVDKVNGDVRVLKEKFDVWENPDTSARKPISEGHKTLQSAEAVVFLEKKRNPEAIFSIVTTQTVQRVVRVIHPA